MKNELKGIEKTPEAEKITLKKVTNWKALGHNGLHGFWFKRFTSLPESLAQQLRKYQ